MVANSDVAAMPKRTSLPSMLPPDCVPRGADFDPELGEVGIARLFGAIDDEHSDQEHDAHRGKDRPALPRIADHLAERVGQPGRNHEDHQHLNEVGERRRVLKRMGGVGIEEAAAVGADHLDRFLRRDRTLRDDLRLAFQRRDRSCRNRGSESRPASRGRARRRARAAGTGRRRRGSGPPRSCRSAFDCCRAKPRISAMAMATPAAAETKFCTVSAAICTR